MSVSDLSVYIARYFFVLVLVLVLVIGLEQRVASSARVQSVYICVQFQRCLIDRSITCRGRPTNPRAHGTAGAGCLFCLFCLFVCLFIFDPSALRIYTIKRVVLDGFDKTTITHDHPRQA